MKQKIISMLLVLTIGLTTIIPAYGLDASDMSENSNLCTCDVDAIVNALMDISVDKESYDFGDVDFSLLSVGENIPVYRCENDALSLVEFKMYPIFSGSELVAFAVVSDSGTEYVSAQIFRNIADDVNALNIAWDDALYFVYDSNGFNVVCDTEVSTLSPLVDNSCTDTYVPASNDSMDYAVVLGENEVQLTNYDTYSIQPRISNYISTPVTAITQVPSLYNHLCWAASVACIGRALTGTIYSASTVAKRYYGSESDFDYPAYCSQARDALKNIYGVSYNTYPSVPSDTRIRNNISGGYPLYGQFEGDGVSHAVVIYSSDSYSGYIGIMDPYTASKFNIYQKYNSSKGVWTYGYTNPYVNGGTIYLTQHVCKSE